MGEEPAVPRERHQAFQYSFSPLPVQGRLFRVTCPFGHLGKLIAGLVVPRIVAEEDTEPGLAGDQDHRGTQRSGRGVFVVHLEVPRINAIRALQQPKSA